MSLGLLALCDRQNPADDHSSMLGECLFLVLLLWVREPDLGLRPHASQGDPSTAEIFLWNPSCQIEVHGQPFLCLYPSNQSQGSFFVSP